MAPINEDDQLNQLGSSQVDDGIESGPRCAPSAKDIIYQNNDLAYY